MDPVYLNATTRAYEKYLQTLQPGHTKNVSKTPKARGLKEGFDENRFRFGDFRTKLHTASGSQGSGSTSKVQGTGKSGKTDGMNTIPDLTQVSRENMTMDEYKVYIREKIYRIPVNPSQALNSVAVDITEEGFEAMKNDPEYEEWVMSGLRADFASYDPWSSLCGGHYVVHHFGASREEYRGESWYPEYQGGSGKSMFESRAEKSFWERRSDSIQTYLKEQEMLSLHQRRLDRINGNLPKGTYQTNILQTLGRLYYAGYYSNVK